MPHRLDTGAAVGRRGMLQKSLLAGAAAAALPYEALAADAPSGLPSATVRRVVTGNNAEGKSVVIKDETLKRGENMWLTSADEPMGHGLPEDTHALLPTVGRLAEMPPGGTRGFFFTIQPAKAPFDRIAIKSWERIRSVVYILFLNGEVTYILDDSEVKMRAGDVLIQRNAQHAWYNHTDTPVTAFAVLVQV